MYMNINYYNKSTVEKPSLSGKQKKVQRKVLAVKENIHQGGTTVIFTNKSSFQLPLAA